MNKITNPAAEDHVFVYRKWLLIILFRNFLQTSTLTLLIIHVYIFI